MWCCWISPDHNRFQPRGRRAPGIGPPECAAVEAQVSIRLRVSTKGRCIFSGFKGRRRAVIPA